MQLNGIRNEWNEKNLLYEYVSQKRVYFILNEVIIKVCRSVRNSKRFSTHKDRIYLRFNKIIFHKCDNDFSNNFEYL